MSRYEYRVVPSPRKGVSAKGVKGSEGKFAHALTIVMNEQAAEGWQYLRSDTLPCDERQGLTGKTTKYHAMLVFRRALDMPEEVVSEPQLALPKPEEEPAEDAPEVSAPAPTHEPSQDEPVLSAEVEAIETEDTSALDDKDRPTV